MIAHASCPWIAAMASRAEVVGWFMAEAYEYLAAMTSTVRFDRVGHLVRLPVTVGRTPCRFLLDTGIGVNVVSPGLAEQLGLQPTGDSFSGRRMSGQEVRADLVRLPPISIGEVVLHDQVAAVATLGPEEGDDGFAGILGLTGFDRLPVSVDPFGQTLRFEAPETPHAVVPLEVRRDGPSTDPFAGLVLPDGSEITVEVDSGSGRLILDDRFLDAGTVRTSGEVRVEDGTDETGHLYRRRFARLDGSVHLAGAEGTAHAGAPVIFQRIIHDGLIGTEFLDRFRWTVDVAGGRLCLGPLGSG